MANERSSERENTERRPKPGAFLIELCYLLGLIAVGLWIAAFWLGLAYFLFGILLFIFAVFLTGIKFVPQPENWVIEQFGQFRRNLKPGLNYVVPLIESVREEILIAEQSLSIFASRPKIDFRDAEAGLKDPRLYFKPDSTHPEDAVYQVEDYKKWLEDTIESIFGGYLNTLSTHEAIDQGMGRGNLIDRLKKAPRFTQDQLKTINQELGNIQRDIDADTTTTVMVRILKLRKQETEREKAKLLTRLTNQRQLRQDYNRLHQEASGNGIKIVRVVIADYELDESVVTAREAPLVARLKAEAAIYEATREATLRTEPIRLAQERFIDLGFSQSKALEKALQLEVMETLANTGSLFLTGGGKGEGIDIESIVARAAAVAATAFAEASKKTAQKQK